MIKPIIIPTFLLLFLRSLVGTRCRFSCLFSNILTLTPPGLIFPRTSLARVLETRIRTNRTTTNTIRITLLHTRFTPRVQLQHVCKTNICARRSLGNVYTRMLIDLTERVWLVLSAPAPIRSRCSRFERCNSI